MGDLPPSTESGVLGALLSELVSRGTAEARTVQLAPGATTISESLQSL
jgi:hypothetical protein